MWFEELKVLKVKEDSAVEWIPVELCSLMEGRAEDKQLLCLVEKTSAGSCERLAAVPVLVDFDKGLGLFGKEVKCPFGKTKLTGTDQVKV